MCSKALRAFQAGKGRTSNADLQQPSTVTVAAVLVFRRAFALAGGTEVLDFELHQPIDHTASGDTGQHEARGSYSLAVCKD